LSSWHKRSSPPAPATRACTSCWPAAATPLLAQRLRRAGLAAARERTWSASLAQLAAGYRGVTARTRRRSRTRVA
jgi:hypothetical protein